MTTKYVKYCSYYRAPCIGASHVDCGEGGCTQVNDADIFICLQDAALVVQPDPVCGLPVTTILAQICQAYTLNDGCGKALWHYTFSYDDEQLISPDNPLVAGDIAGFFCADCMTDWIQQQISCVETGGGGSGSVVPYYSNVCAGIVTEVIGEGIIFTKAVAFDSAMFSSCGQRIDFKLAGTWSMVSPETAVLEITFGGEGIGSLTFDTDTSGLWYAEGYISRGVFNDTEWVCFGFNRDFKTNDADNVTVDSPAFSNVSIGLPFPDTLDFQVHAAVSGGGLSQVTLDQMILDYYDVPVICEEGDTPSACCD